MSLARLRALAVFVAAACALTAGAVRVAGQAGRGVTETHAAAIPRAPDGRPDFQGVWNFSTLTPLERPANLADKKVFTPEEAMAYERDAIARNDADRRDGGAAVDVSRAYNDAWYDRGTRLAVIGGVRPTSLITDPPDGRIPTLTPEAERRATERAEVRRDHPADNPENRSLAERCLAFNAGPPMLPGPYNNYVQIFQAPDHVMLLNEMIHDARIVSLDNRPHLAATIHRFLGDSTGRWDGNTLVVDTTNFTDETNFRGADARLHLVERLTLADGDTLVYSFTVDDPTAFTRPWTAVLAMKRENAQIYEYACHEGNYALASILRGARAEERAPQR